MKTIIKKNDNIERHFSCFECKAVFKGDDGWQVTVYKGKVSETTFLCNDCKKSLDK